MGLLPLLLPPIITPGGPILLVVAAPVPEVAPPVPVVPLAPPRIAVLPRIMRVRVRDKLERLLLVPLPPPPPPPPLAPVPLLLLLVPEDPPMCPLLELKMFKLPLSFFRQTLYFFTYKMHRKLWFCI